MWSNWWPQQICLVVVQLIKDQQGEHQQVVNYGGNVNADNDYGGKSYRDQSYATQESINRADNRAAQTTRCKQNKDKQK